MAKTPDKAGSIFIDDDGYVVHVKECEQFNGHGDTVDEGLCTRCGRGLEPGTYEDRECHCDPCNATQKAWDDHAAEEFERNAQDALDYHAQIREAGR